MNVLEAKHRHALERARGDRIADSRLTRGQLVQPPGGGLGRDELLGRRRQGPHAFEDGEREQREQPEKHAVQRAGAHGRHGRGEHDGDGNPAESQHRTVPGACGKCLAPGRAPHLPVGFREPRQPVVRGVVGDQLRQRIEQIDDAGGDRSALRGAPAGGRPSGGDDRKRHENAADDERAHERQTGGRCERARHCDRCEADDERCDRRREDANEQVLERVHIGDKAAEEITGPCAPDLVRHERLEAGEEPHASP